MRIKPLSFKLLHIYSLASEYRFSEHQTSIRDWRVVTRRLLLYHHFVNSEAPEFCRLRRTPVKSQFSSRISNASESVSHPNM